MVLAKAALIFKARQRRAREDIQVNYLRLRIRIHSRSERLNLLSKPAPHVAALHFRAFYVLVVRWAWRDVVSLDHLRLRGEFDIAYASLHYLRVVWRHRLRTRRAVSLARSVWSEAHRKRPRRVFVHENRGVLLRRDNRGLIGRRFAAKAQMDLVRPRSKQLAVALRDVVRIRARRLHRLLLLGRRRIKCRRVLPWRILAYVLYVISVGRRASVLQLREMNARAERVFPCV